MLEMIPFLLANLILISNEEANEQPLLTTLTATVSFSKSNIIQL